MEKKVSINQRISIPVIEMAMTAALDGRFSTEYAYDLAAGEYQGANRIAKARGLIGKITVRNPLYPYIEEHKDEFLAAIKYRGDRAVIYASLINAAFCFGYDTCTFLGKFFHVQDEVTTALLAGRLSTIYASNRTLPNAMNCVLPMLIEAGFIARPRLGFFTRSEFEVTTQFARDLYKKSFLVNNPLLSEDIDYSDHPYFEFF